MAVVFCVDIQSLRFDVSSVTVIVAPFEIRCLYVTFISESALGFCVACVLFDSRVSFVRLSVNYRFVSVTASFPLQHEQRIHRSLAKSCCSLDLLGPCIFTCRCFVISGFHSPEHRSAVVHVVRPSYFIFNLTFPGTCAAACVHGD